MNKDMHIEYRNGKTQIIYNVNGFRCHEILNDYMVIDYEKISACTGKRHFTILVNMATVIHMDICIYKGDKE